MQNNSYEIQPFLVGGEWITGKSSYPIIHPFDNHIVAHISIPSLDQVQLSVDRAHKAFTQTRALSSEERYEILHKMAHALKEKREEFARTIALENGKPLKFALIEVDRCLTTLTSCAEEAKRLPGEFPNIDIASHARNKIAIVKRFPMGPVLGISAFNFPLNLVAHKLGPAIAVGNPIIIKPAERTPLTAFKLIQLALDAGYPKEALSVLPIDRTDQKSLDFLLNDSRIKIISFTGSANVGWKLKSMAGTKRVVLELGGNAAVVVHEDADLKTAVQKITAAAFGFAGQSCISAQRILVHSMVYDEFKKLFLDEISKLKAGNPLTPDTDIGPMIDESAAMRAEQWLKEAVQEGAQVLCGGKRERALLYPTVLENVNPHSKCYREEVFAPLKSLVKYNSFEQALEMVNDSVYGLQAGIFTQDINRAFKAFNELDVGGVIINDVPTFRVDNLAYGGIKQSGFGREGAKYAIEEFTELKVLVIELKK